MVSHCGSVALLCRGNIISILSLDRLLGLLHAVILSISGCLSGVQITLRKACRIPDDCELEQSSDELTDLLEEAVAASASSKSMSSCKG